jgi:hypothetical protein
MSHRRTHRLHMQSLSIQSHRLACSLPPSIPLPPPPTRLIRRVALHGLQPHRPLHPRRSIFPHITTTMYTDLRPRRFNLSKHSIHRRRPNRQLQDPPRLHWKLDRCRRTIHPSPNIHRLHVLLRHLPYSHASPPRPYITSHSHQHDINLGTNVVHALYDLPSNFHSQHLSTRRIYHGKRKLFISKRVADLRFRWRTDDGCYDGVWRLVSGSVGEAEEGVYD